MSGLDLDLVSTTLVFCNKHVLLNTKKGKKFSLNIPIQSSFCFEWEVNYHCIDEPAMTCEYTIELVKGAENFLGIIDLDIEIWNTDKSQHSFFFDSRLTKTFKESLILKGNNAVTVTMRVCSNYNSIPVKIENKFPRKNENNQIITFVVQDEVIPAHQDIMSNASEVFAKMFDTDMLEKKNNTVTITDIEPSGFKEFLNFIYFRKVDTENIDDLLKVLLAADKYSYSFLMDDCAENIGSKLTVDNVVDCLITADLTKNYSLKDKCIEYMGNAVERVAITDSYKDMIKAGRTELLSEIYIKTVDNFRRYPHGRNMPVYYYDDLEDDEVPENIRIQEE